MAHVSLTYEIEDFEFNGQTYGMTLTLDADLSPYDPGCTYGPPENCYPPEGGEIEDLDVVVEAANSSDCPNVSDAVLAELQAEVNRQIKDGGPLCDGIEAFIYENPPDPPEPESRY